MRIIGGSLGGRRIPAPRVKGVRPTSDRVREALASALSSRGKIAGAVVVELFAGTGALSFEMLSRGATRAVLVERSRRMVQAIDQAAVDLGLGDRVRVLTFDLGRSPGEAARAIAAALGEPATLLLADPPYNEVDRVAPLAAALGSEGALTPETLIVLEHATRSPPKDLSGLATVARYRYGDTTVVMATVSGEE